MKMLAAYKMLASSKILADAQIVGVWQKYSRTIESWQACQGLPTPDHEVRAWKYPITPHWRGR